MLQKTKGIVLHTLKYNDTSIIVDMYTELSGGLLFSFLYPVRGRRQSSQCSSSLCLSLSLRRISVRMLLSIG